MFDLLKKITYDIEELGSMKTEELLIQIIARQDLRMPKREHQLNAKLLHNEAVARANEFLAEIESVGIPDLSETVRSVIAKYDALEEAVVHGS